MRWRLKCCRSYRSYFIHLNCEPNANWNTLIVRPSSPFAPHKFVWLRKFCVQFNTIAISHNKSTQSFSFVSHSVNSDHSAKASKTFFLITRAGSPPAHLYLKALHPTLSCKAPLNYTASSLHLRWYIWHYTSSSTQNTWNNPDTWNNAYVPRSHYPSQGLH